MSEDHTVLDRDDLLAVEHGVLETVATVARELHSGRTHSKSPGLDDALDRDFGLDSLSRVELCTRLERLFDVSLDEQRVFEASTPRDLLRLVVRSRSGKPLVLRSEVLRDASPAALSLPERATTLPEMLHWHAEKHAERAHIQLYDDYSDGEIISYGELYRGAIGVAADLQARGLEPGARVAIMLPTGRDYFLSFYGIVLAGGVPVPIYPPVRRQQLEDHLRRQQRILANCRASMLITTREAATLARLLTAAVSSLEHVLTTDDLATGGGGRFEPVPVAPDATAFLQYTSGSTGDPKGVILSHANLLANVRADGAGMGVDNNDVFVSWLPLYHDMGLIGAWLGSLYHGVRLVVMPPLSFLSRPERWLWALHRHHGTLSAAPNFAFELCVKRCRDEDLEGLDLSRWRIAANGAEAISPSTLNAFCERFGRYGFKRESMFPVYGLAECSVGLAFTPLGRGPRVDSFSRATLSRRGVAEPCPSAGEDALRLVGCGFPLPGHEIRIVDESGREQPDRHEGRLQFRGPSATRGYFERPQATATLFDGDWLETGDRAFLDGGELFVTGRSKDLIIRAGRNIHPAELEDAIGNLDGIRKGHVAAFGVHDVESGTERLVVMAETRRRRPEALAALRSAIDACATTLLDAPADEVALVPPNAVLRTSSGKIRRAASREVYLAGTDGLHERAVWLQVLRLALIGTGPQLLRLSARLARTAYAAWAWSVFGAAALLTWSLAWLPLPGRTLWRCARACARLAAALSGLSIATANASALPREGQAGIVVCNHQSYLDGLVLTAALNRPVRFVVKAELAESKLLAQPLRKLGVLFVERFDARAGVSSMQAAGRALAQGETLVVFPEGTFKRMPGLLPFHLGAFVTAIDNDTAVVPLAIRGTRSILRAHTWFPRRGPIEIEFGDPIPPPQAADRWARVTALRDATRAVLLSLCGEPDLSHESNAVDGSMQP